MSLRIRRGTEAQRPSTPVDLGEIIWTTDAKKLYVGDGVSLGGVNILATSVDGAHGIAWDAATQTLRFNGTGTGIVSVSADPNPSLGGNLNLLGRTINGNGNINITGTITATQFVGVTVSSDLAPSLGGNLNLTNKNIIGTGNIDILGNVAATAITPHLLGTPVSIQSSSFEPLDVQSITDGSANIALMSVSVSKGSLASPTNTAPGDLLGGYKMQAWTNGTFKFAASIVAGWASTADLTTNVPASKLLFVTGNNGSGASLNYAIFDHLGNFTAPAITPGVYATTTARDLALPTPSAGMMVYITAGNLLQCYSNDTWKTVTLTS